MKRMKKWLALFLSVAVCRGSVPVYGGDVFSDSPQTDYSIGDEEADAEGLFQDGEVSDDELFSDSAGEGSEESTQQAVRRGSPPARGQGNSQALAYAEGEAIVWMKGNEGLLRANFPYETEILLDNAAPMSEEEELYASPAGNDNTGTALLVKGNGESTDALIDKLLDYPEIELAEPNYIISLENFGEPQRDEQMSLSGVAPGKSVAEDTLGDTAVAENRPGDTAAAGLQGDPAAETDEFTDEADQTEEPYFFGDSAEPYLFGDSAEPPMEDEYYDGYQDMSRGEWNKQNQGQMGGVPGMDMNVKSVWEKYGTGSSDVVVAVVDTGVAYTHPDLENQMWTQGLNYPQLTALGGGPYGLNCVSQKGYSSVNPYDDNEHGTHCAGIVAAADDGAGTTGVAPGVKVMAVKVLNGDGMGDVASSIRGFSYVLAAVKAGVNVKVANYSVGGSYLSAINTKIYDVLGEAGVVTCLASGNSGQNLDAYTFITSSVNVSPYALKVNAMQPSGKVAYFSNYGKKYTNIFAPGCSVLSTVPEEKAKFLAEFAEGNILYSGFEPSGNLGTDSAPVGAGLDFYQYDPGAFLGMGARIEPTDTNNALGSRSVSVTGNAPEIISAPINLGQVPSGEYYFSMAGICDKTYGFPIVSLVDGNGREYELESTKGEDALYYVERSVWGNNDFIIPEEFSAWDNFQIKIKVEDFFQKSSDYTSWLDCIGIGVQKVPYTYMTGTSMAAPAVSGEAALLASLYPHEGADVIAAAVRGGVTRSEELQELCLEGGRTDIERAVENPFPVIFKVVNLGDTFLVYGQFSGQNASVSIDGVQAEILDVCDSYIEAKVPEGLQENIVEIGISTDTGTGHYYWILGKAGTGYQSLPITMDDKMLEEFSEITWMDMESRNGSLYLLGNPEILGIEHPQKIWACDISEGTWRKLPSPYDDMNSIYDICVYNNELYASGVTVMNGIQTVFISCWNDKTGKWKSFADLELALHGGLFTYQGMLYYGGGVMDEEKSKEVYRILPEKGTSELCEMELPQEITTPRLEERGKELLLYGDGNFETPGIWLYDGMEWRELPFPEQISKEQDFQIAAEAVEEGYLLTGLVKNPDSSDDFTDTWLLRITGEAFSYEEYPEVFCPVKGSGYIGEANGKSFYVMAYVPQKGGYILKKLSGIKAYAEVLPEKQGWHTEKGKTYYYEGGHPVTGFKKINGVTYYFYEGSKAASCKAGTLGQMVTGWLTLKKSGRMFYLWDGNKKTKCNAKAKGGMCTGWVTFSNKARFFFNNGNKKVKSNTSQRGQMATGWLTGSGGKSFYLWTGDKKVKCSAKKKGQMAVGWLTFPDKSRYFLWTADKKLKSKATQRGQMVTGRMYDSKNKKYYKFRNNGKLY